MKIKSGLISALISFSAISGVAGLTGINAQADDVQAPVVTLDYFQGNYVLDKASEYGEKCAAKLQVTLASNPFSQSNEIGLDIVFDEKIVHHFLGRNAGSKSHWIKQPLENGQVVSDRLGYSYSAREDKDARVITRLVTIERNPGTSAIERAFHKNQVRYYEETSAILETSGTLAIVHSISDSDQGHAANSFCYYRLN
ncbi:hypothetical protein WDW37_16410 [Bdellovibrionota bacterium FG-1]